MPQLLEEILYLQLVIVVPELGQDIIQQLAMIGHKGAEFLVVPSLVYPTQALFRGQMAELGRVVANQNGDDGHVPLGIIGCQGSRFPNPGLLLFIEPGSQIPDHQLLYLLRGQPFFLRPLPDTSSCPPGYGESFQPTVRLFIVSR